MGRFISSYALSRAYNPLVGLRLSYVIKDSIGRYYKGFSLCEHPLNRGDLTPFVIMFSEMVVESMESMRDSLADKKATLAHANSLVARISGIGKGREGIVKDRFNLASLLIQAALFAESGISAKEAASVMGISEPTLYKRLDFFKSRDLVEKRSTGRRVFYVMDLAALMRATE